jgi:riboflavin biosynthesis pyrimidine reductase
VDVTAAFNALVADLEYPMFIVTARAGEEPLGCLVALRGSLEEGVRASRRDHGVRSLLCEGGPQLLGDVARAGLVDELHLVIAPKLAAGTDPLTILGGEALDPPADLDLRSVHESGGYLFLRYGLTPWPDRPGSLLDLPA